MKKASNKKIKIKERDKEINKNVGNDDYAGRRKQAIKLWLILHPWYKNSMLLTEHLKIKRAFGNYEYDSRNEILEVLEEKVE